MTAHSVLHAFYGGPDNLVGKLGWLDAAAIERLRPPPLPHRPGPVRLDDGDRKLLALLATDGRAGFEQLAAATGWSPTTVRRRMTELREHGVLYLDLDVDWRVFGGNARPCSGSRSPPPIWRRPAGRWPDTRRSRSPRPRPARPICMRAWCARTNGSCTGT